MAGREVFGREEMEQVQEVLQTGVLFRYGFDGERGGVFKVRDFEEQFARYIGAGHALGVTSGSGALKVALEALNLPKGKEVITPCFTFVATIEAIEEAGLKPVLCEIDETLNMSLQDAKKKITQDTVCIMPVHMMGAAANMDDIMSLAGENRLKVVEDACQSTGASFHGKRAGTFGDTGCFSFDYVKVMTAGEGGMLVTDDENIYKQAEYYHDHGHPHLPNLGRGQEKRARKGFNYRMNEIQGALGIAQLKKLDGIIAGQRENKKKIKTGIQKNSNIEFRRIPDRQGEIATFLSMLLSESREADRFKSMLSENGVAPATLNYWHFEANVEIAGGSFQKSEDILNRTVAIEIKTIMDDNVIAKTIEAINRAARGI